VQLCGVAPFRQGSKLWPGFNKTLVKGSTWNSVVVGGQGSKLQGRLLGHSRLAIAPLKHWPHFNGG
jgi:hypothetical protein